MPIIDMAPGGRDREFKVSKGGLDPFAQKRQALDIVKNRTTAPSDPNMRGLEYGIEDRGDHFLVTVAAGRPDAGPGFGADDRPKRPKRSKAQQKGQGRGGGGATRIPTTGPPSGPLTGLSAFDLASQLQRKSKAELMRAADEANLYTRQGMGRRELADALVRRAPAKARRLTGRL